MNSQVKLGIIGLGARAETLLATLFKMQSAVAVTAICDLNPERIEKIHSIFDAHPFPRPKAYGNYRELLVDTNVEAVFVPTSWNSHLQIACDCMRQGKYVGIEVGGASSVEELWQLVHAHELTGVHCMMLENCCYGRNELMVLNMVIRPGAIVVVADAFFRKNGGANAGCTALSGLAVFGSSKDMASFALNHGASGKMAFADGHVSAHYMEVNNNRTIANFPCNGGTYPFNKVVTETGVSLTGN